jgi:hypothetical protein
LPNRGEDNEVGDHDDRDYSYPDDNPAAPFVVVSSSRRIGCGAGSSEWIAAGC